MLKLEFQNHANSTSSNKRPHGRFFYGRSTFDMRLAQPWGRRPSSLDCNHRNARNTGCATLLARGASTTFRFALALTKGICTLCTATKPGSWPLARIVAFTPVTSSVNATEQVLIGGIFAIQALLSTCNFY